MDLYNKEHFPIFFWSHYVHWNLEDNVSTDGHTEHPCLDSDLNGRHAFVLSWFKIPGVDF